jgi:hydroxymethylbilane synthase
LRSIRPDLEIVELRGNMKTRLAMAGSNGVDAVITAAAALIRLAETKLIADRLDPSVFTPQVAQGALALECRVGDPLSDLLRAVDNHDVHRCLDAERSFQETLGVGCTVPAGAWCIVDDDALWLRAAMLDESMSAIERHERRGTDPIELGREVARSFTATGRNI